MTPMPDAVLDLLRAPNPAVVATTRKDGRPVSAAVWYLWQGDGLLLTMGVRSARRRQLERDPRLTLTVLARDSWYRQVTLHGDVLDLRDDEDFAVTDRLSMQYEGEPWGRRDVPHAAARVAIVDWNAFGMDLG